MSRIPLLLAAALCSSAALAQADWPMPPPRADVMFSMGLPPPIDDLADRVRATDSQRARLQAIEDEFGPQLQDLGRQLAERHRAMMALDSQAPTFATDSATAADSIGRLTGEHELLQAQMRQRVDAVLSAEQRELLVRRDRRVLMRAP